MDIFSLKKQALILAYVKGYRIRDGKIFNPKGIEINGFISNNYKLFGFSIKFEYERKKINVPVHQFIAYQKFGNKIFEVGIQVRHKDNNSLNNLENNILIGTAYDNTMDKSEETRMRTYLYASSQNRKFSNEEMSQIKADYLNQKSYNRIMKKYNISSRGTLHYILNNNYVTTK